MTTARRILVTGGAGFIGSNFIRFVLANRPGASVINADVLTYSGNLENLDSIAADPRYRFERADICDAARMAELINACDAVVHFADAFKPGPAGILGAEDVRQAENRTRVAHLLELLGRRGPGALAGRIGRHPVGVPGLDLFQFVHQPVVLGVADYRRVEHVVVDSFERVRTGSCEEPMTSATLENTQESAFLDALGQARAWQVTGDTLALTGEAGRVARFAAQYLR